MDPEQINEEISDEALEAAGNADRLAIFSLGNCTDARLCQMPN
jgi:hypothetical protein